MCIKTSFKCGQMLFDWRHGLRRTSTFVTDAQPLVCCVAEATLSFSGSNLETQLLIATDGKISCFTVTMRFS